MQQSIDDGTDSDQCFDDDIDFLLPLVFAYLISAQTPASIFRPHMSATSLPISATFGMNRC